MADAPIPTGDTPKRGSKDIKRISASLAILALQRLSDPEVRAQLAKHGRTAADSAREWRAERAARRTSGVSVPGSAPAPTGITGRFGRGKLDRRVERLRSTVLSLGEGRPELARSLDPVLAALEEVTSALDVAAGLALPKRIWAHQRVDHVLDELETGLFEAALPQLPGPYG